MENINTIWKYYLPYMKLHGYLEQLLGSKASISVLRTLVRYRGKIFTIRGLAHDAHVSHPRVSKTVKELDKLGVVQIQPIGRSHQVSLNEKSHILKRIIVPMFEAEERTLDQMILVLKRYLGAEKNTSAAIFGSVPKGQEKEGSDIDVIIISDDFDGAIAAASDAGEEIFAKFHGRISPIVFSESELRLKKRSGLVCSILDNHTMVHGRNLEDLLK